MAQLVFPIAAGELTLTAIIGHNRKSLSAILAAGLSIPPPVWAAAVIDTGTNITCVSPTVLKQLGLMATGQSSSQTAAGRAAVNLFEISLSIPSAGNLPGPMFTREDLIVMEIPGLIPGVDVLVGLDILLDCKVLLDGPARQFTLEF